MAFTQIEAAGITTTSTVVLQNATVTGVLTATSGFTGNLTGNVTGNVSGNVTGNVTGNVSGNVTGNVTTGSVTINSSTNSISGVSTIGITTAYVGAINDGPISGARNRIINGDMRIDQRNAGASVTPADGAYTLDRWQYGATQTSKVSIQQSTTAPAGFSNSLLVTSLSAFTVGSGDLFRVSQLIEGFNFSDLDWGTASAKTVTLSFWVRSSLTGTFGGSLVNGASNRSYLFAYTVSSANTWEQKSITVVGDTTGTWVGSTNGIGARVHFSLGAGSNFSGTAGAWSGSLLFSATGATSIVGTNGATFYITGVQLEAGTVATPFERRSYGQELALCQRYYAKHGLESFVLNGSPGYGAFQFKVSMRSTPTVTLSQGTVLGTNADGFHASLTGTAAISVTATIEL